MQAIFDRVASKTLSNTSARYVFTRNSPYDRTAPIQLVVPRLCDSQAYMRSVREFQVPPSAFAVWFLGQNGFIVKGEAGPLIGIDLYLTDSCATSLAHLPYRLNRQLPVFVEPEDLDIDVFFTTHSHADHADPETIGRMRKGDGIRFIGPFDSVRVYRECGVPSSSCELIHPGETVEVGGSTVLQATFSLPTDHTDLNHVGVLVRFGNGQTFYDTGDSAYSDRLSRLLPSDVDVCAICINGGFHNLSAMEAAEIVKLIRPRVVVPCHYDMMVDNVGSPEMLRVALDLVGSDAHFAQMTYYEPWLYQRA